MTASTRWSSGVNESPLQFRDRVWHEMTHGRAAMLRGLTTEVGGKRTGGLVPGTQKADVASRYAGRHCVLMNDMLLPLISRFTKAKSQPLDDDFSRWAEDRNDEVVQLLDYIGGEIAKAYHTDELTYDYCDQVVNELWGNFSYRLSIIQDHRWPTLFYEVFNAFDTGEFHRLSDRSDNPVVEHTNPWVAEIVAKLNGEIPGSANDVVDV